MNKFFTKPEFHDIQNLDDMDLCTESIHQLYERENNIIFGITFTNYIITFILGATALLLTLNFLGKPPINVPSYTLLFIVGGFMSSLIFNVISKVTQNFTWREKLSSKFFNCFGKYRSITKECDNKIQLLEKFLSNKEIQYTLIAYLEDLENKLLSINSGKENYSKKDINKAKNELIFAFANENYSSATQYIVDNFSTWKEHKLKYFNDVKKQKANRQSEELVKNYCKENKLPYVEDDEIELEFSKGLTIDFKSRL